MSEALLQNLRVSAVAAAEMAYHSPTALLSLRSALKLFFYIKKMNH